jgi:hypothetical protein
MEDVHKILKFLGAEACEQKQVGVASVLRTRGLVLFFSAQGAVQRLCPWLGLVTLWIGTSFPWLEGKGFTNCTGPKHCAVQ